MERDDLNVLAVEMRDECARLRRSNGRLASLNALLVEAIEAWAENEDYHANGGRQDVYDNTYSVVSDRLREALARGREGGA